MPSSASASRSAVARSRHKLLSRLDHIETPAVAALVAATRDTALVPLARLASRFGEYGTGWIAVALATAVRARGRDPARARDWLAAALAVVGAFTAVQVVKRLLPRARPDVPRGVRLYSNRSFPSAHAACAVAFATSAPLSGRARVLAWAAAGWVAASRIVLGVHYPSDVAAGAALGALVGRTAARGGAGAERRATGGQRP
ncbi:MAG: phosphatase PAP2 family protein [Thermoleophilum sp.]|nr:phosphatase PAP2 family protein [Thermoleophilum sp.]